MFLSQIDVIFFDDSTYWPIVILLFTLETDVSKQSSRSFRGLFLETFRSYLRDISAFTSLQCQGSKPSNFEMILRFSQVKKQVNRSAFYKISGGKFDNWFFRPEFYNIVRLPTFIVQ